MKKILFIVICVAVSVLEAVAGPEASWLSTSFNFGAFDEDNGRVSCDFRFVNTGDEPLTIISTRASCGCTQPVFPREAIAPGDTSQISVTYNPTARPGRFTKTIAVETNGVPRRVKLTITGVVIGAQSSIAGRYPVDMGALRFRNGAIMFGQIKKPQMKTINLGAYNRSTDSVRVRIDRKPAFVDIDFVPEIVPPGEQMTAICYFRSHNCKEWGLVEDSVTVVAGKDRFVLPVTAIINEDFSKLPADKLAKAPVAQLSEPSVDFGRISRDGGTLSRTVTLTNRGKSNLEIRRVYTTDPGVTVAVDHDSLKKDKSAVITVTVDPKVLPTDILNARISLITNDPANPTQILRVLGEL